MTLVGIFPSVQNRYLWEVFIFVVFFHNHWSSSWICGESQCLHTPGQRIDSIVANWIFRFGYVNKTFKKENLVTANSLLRRNEGHKEERGWRPESGNPVRGRREKREKVVSEFGAGPLGSCTFQRWLTQKFTTHPLCERCKWWLHVRATCVLHISNMAVAGKQQGPLLVR